MPNPSRYGYRKWMPHNIEVIKKLTLREIEIVQGRLYTALEKVANDIVEHIDSGLIPEYTSNLHDATGVGIYVNGALKKFIPTKRATRTQSFRNGTSIERGINGTEYLSQALSDAAGDFSTNVWLVIISAVPYAWFINKDGSPLGRGEDFFEDITSKATSEIFSELRKLNVRFDNTINSFSKL